MKIGIYEKAINNKFSWKDKIDIAKSAGYDFIEFSVDESAFRMERLDWNDEKIDQLKSLLIEKKFYFNSMALSGLRKYPLGSKDKKTRNLSIDITKKAIILAKKLGIRAIQLAGYDVYYQKGDQETRDIFIKSVREIIKIAAEYSVMLSFEIMDTKFMGTITNYLSILKDIKSPWLSIYPDLGNLWQWSKDTIEEEISKGYNQIIAFHFKDTKENIFRDVPFGDGNVDFKRIMRHLKKLHYNGPMLIEMWSENNESESLSENIEKIKKAYNFFKEVQNNV